MKFKAYFTQNYKSYAIDFESPEKPPDQEVIALITSEGYNEIELETVQPFTYFQREVNTEKDPWEM